MTRKEEILQAADKYIHKRVYEEDCGRTGDTFSAFIEGSEWANSHPRKGLVDIDKVCEWIKEYGNAYITATEEDGYYLDRDLISDLKKSMEE